MIAFKAGVPQDRPHKAVLKARAVYEQCLAAFFKENVATVTSTHDGAHGKNSYHYSKPRRAEDYRLPLALRSMLTTLRAELGPDYDVVLERDHVHIEFDPKGV